MHKTGGSFCNLKGLERHNCSSELFMKSVWRGKILEKEKKNIFLKGKTVRLTANRPLNRNDGGHKTKVWHISKTKRK